MYDLRVEVEKVEGFCDLPMSPGDYFEVKGGKIILPDDGYICLWALQSMLPFLTVKQRKIDETNDWTPHTSRFTCPDPNGRVIFKIIQVDTVTGDILAQDQAKKIKPPARLIANEEKCTGCRACETICSFTHFESFNGEKARIKVIKNEAEGLDIPHVCHQCGDASCLKACPVNALSKDKETGAVLVNEEKCIGCMKCAEACPFDSISFIADREAPLICDLCKGEVECVKRCPVEAIQFGTAAELKAL